MSKFTLEIETDNAAFEDRDFEVERILRHVAGCVGIGCEEGVILDHNGNTCGYYEFIEEDE